MTKYKVFLKGNSGLYSLDKGKRLFMHRATPFEEGIVEVFGTFDKGRFAFIKGKNVDESLAGTIDDFVKLGLNPNFAREVGYLGKFPIFLDGENVYSVINNKICLLARRSIDFDLYLGIDRCLSNGIVGNSVSILQFLKKYAMRPMSIEDTKFVEAVIRNSYKLNSKVTILEGFLLRVEYEKYYDSWCYFNGEELVDIPQASCLLPKNPSVVSITEKIIDIADNCMVARGVTRSEVQYLKYDNNGICYWKDNLVEGERGLMFLNSKFFSFDLFKEKKDELEDSKKGYFAYTRALGKGLSGKSAVEVMRKFNYKRPQYSGTEWS